MFCLSLSIAARMKDKTTSYQVPRVLLPSKRVGIRTQGEYEAHCESGLSGPSRCLTIATLLASADYNDDDDDIYIMMRFLCVTKNDHFPLPS